MRGVYEFQMAGAFGTLLSHFPQRQPLVRDIPPALRFGGVSDDSEADQLLMHARARSGDYFVTLATELDELARSIQGYGTQTVQDEAVERLVLELLYLQKHYRITPKDDW